MTAQRIAAGREFALYQLQMGLCHVANVHPLISAGRYGRGAGEIGAQPLMGFRETGVAGTDNRSGVGDMYRYTLILKAAHIFLAGYLGSAVGIAGSTGRRILVEETDGRIVQGRHTGYVDDPGETAFRRASDYQFGAADIGFHDPLGVLLVYGHQRSRVHDRITACQRLVHGGGIGNIAQHIVGDVAAVHPPQLVLVAHQQPYPVPGRGQGHGRVVADKAGAAGDHYPHEQVLLSKKFTSSRCRD